MEHINQIKTPTLEDLTDTANLAIEELTFYSDERAEATYRASLAKTYIYRGLKEVFGL
jgi:CO/xanthine dehydrogenase FAD-binding subunit